MELSEQFDNLELTEKKPEKGHTLPLSTEFTESTSVLLEQFFKQYSYDLRQYWSSQNQTIFDVLNRCSLPSNLLDDEEIATTVYNIYTNEIVERLAQCSSIRSVEEFSVAINRVTLKKGSIKKFVLKLVRLREIITYHVWGDLMNLCFPERKSSPPTESQRSEATLFKNAFVNSNDFNPKLLLRRKIEDVMDVSKQGYYSPYFSLCQSSGFGKTRLALEMSDQFLVFYLCCRKTNSDGYPIRTEGFIDFISNLTSIYEWTTMIFSIMALCILKFPDRDNILDRVQTFSLEQATNRDMQRENFDRVIQIYNICFPYFLPSKSELSLTLEQTGNWLQKALLTNLQSFMQAATAADKKADFTEILQNLDKCLHDSLVTPQSKSHGTSLQETSLDNVISMLKLVLVVDEASNIFLEENVGMKECFSNFRRALRVFDAKFLPVVALVLDTNFRVGNFPPYSTFDNSARVIEGSLLLVHPFYHFPLVIPLQIETGSQNVTKIISASVEGFMQDSSKTKFISNIFRLGLQSRPLFAVKTNQILKSSVIPVRDFIKDVLILAIFKLCNGNVRQVLKLNLDVTDTKESIRFYALLASRFYLVSTVSLVKDLLIKQHLGTLVGISPDRNILNVIYPSEPIIAAASQAVSLKAGVFEKMLETLVYFAHGGALSTNDGKGEMGELLACLILARAADLLSFSLYDGLVFESQNQMETVQVNTPNYNIILPALDTSFLSVYSHPIPLMNYLEILYSQDHYKQIFQKMQESQYSQQFYRSVIYFNHFIKVDYHITLSDLPFYLERGAAVVCINGETGIDIVIPIAIPNKTKRKNSGTVNIYDTDTYHVSALIVQVKNWQVNFKPDELGVRMTESKLATEIYGEYRDYLLLIMNVGSGVASSKYNSNCCLSVPWRTSKPPKTAAPESSTTPQKSAAPESSSTLEKAVVTLIIDGLPIGIQRRSQPTHRFPLIFTESELKHLRSLQSYQRYVDLMKKDLSDLGVSDNDKEKMIPYVFPLGIKSPLQFVEK